MAVQRGQTHREGSGQHAGIPAVPLRGPGLKLNLGCGPLPREGWVNVDSVALPGVDLVWNLNERPWPIADDACIAVEMFHVLEHLDDTVAIMNELHRIVAKGGRVEIIVPHCRGIGAWGDPTHKRAFHPTTMDHFTDRAPAWFRTPRWRIIFRRNHGRWVGRFNGGRVPQYVLFELLRLRPSEITWLMEPLK